VPHVRLSVRGPKMICFDCFWLIDFAKAMVGFPRISCGVWWRLAHFMRLSLLKAAHAAVGECHVAGNPGRPLIRPTYAEANVGHPSSSY
jgi:hypothetical protein